MGLMLSEVIVPPVMTTKAFRDSFREATSLGSEQIDDNVPFICTESSLTSAFVKHGLCIDELIAFLLSNNYICASASGDRFVVTKSGENVRRAISGKRFSRSVADGLIVDVQRRAQQYNLHDAFSIIPIECLIIFGSYLDSQNAALGDIDLVLRPMFSFETEWPKKQERFNLMYQWAEEQGKRPSIPNFGSDVRVYLDRVIKYRNPRISIMPDEHSAGLNPGDVVGVVYPFVSVGRVEKMHLCDLESYLQSFDRSQEVAWARRNVDRLKNM